MDSYVIELLFHIFQDLSKNKESLEPAVLGFLVLCYRKRCAPKALRCSNFRYFTSLREILVKGVQPLYEHSVVQSLSNSSKPYDNAVAESFFATFKKEEVYRKNYTSEADPQWGVDSYIEFYNTQRSHRTLKNPTHVR